MRKLKNRHPCIKCGNVSPWKQGKSNIGNKKYFCHRCNLRFTYDLEGNLVRAGGGQYKKRKGTKHKVPCLRCGNIYTWSNGTTVNGKKSYRCIDCDYCFCPENLSQRAANNELKFIISSLQQKGVTVKQLSFILNIPLKTLYYWLKQNKQSLLKNH